MCIVWLLYNDFLNFPEMHRLAGGHMISVMHAGIGRGLFCWILCFWWAYVATDCILYHLIDPSRAVYVDTRSGFSWFYHEVITFALFCMCVSLKRHLCTTQIEKWTIKCCWTVAESDLWEYCTFSNTAVSVNNVMSVIMWVFNTAVLLAFIFWST